MGLTVAELESNILSAQSAVLALESEVSTARGTADSLNDRIDVSLNEDGSLRVPVATVSFVVDTTTIMSSDPTGVDFILEGDLTSVYTYKRRLRLNDNDLLTPSVVSSTYDEGGDYTTVVVTPAPGTFVTNVEYSFLPSALPLVLHSDLSTVEQVAESADTVATKHLSNAQFMSKASLVDLLSSMRGKGVDLIGRARKYVYKVDDLNDTPPGTHENVYARCFETIGDGGFGEFEWIDSSEAPPVRGMVHQVTGVVIGRWIRQTASFVTTGMFGGNLQNALSSGYPVVLNSIVTMTANITTTNSIKCLPGSKIILGAYNLVIADFEGCSGCIDSTSSGRISGLKTVVPDWFEYNRGYLITDMTAAMQRAADAVITGGEYRLLAGNYLFSGTQPITITRCINFRGVGRNSQIVVDSTVDNVTDIIKTFPTATQEPSLFENFSIWPISGNPGRYGINVGYNGGGINRCKIENVHVGPLGSYGVYIKGAFSATVENCNLSSGLAIDGDNDNFNILNNTLATSIAANSALYVNVSAVLGNNMFNIIGNVILNTASCQHLLHVVNAGTMSIRDNQFEVNTSLAGYKKSTIYIEGTAARRVYKSVIEANNFNTSPPYAEAVIAVGYAIGTVIDKNTISGGLPNMDPYPFNTIYITANAIATVIGDNFHYSYTRDYNSDRIMDEVYDAVYNPLGRIFDDGFGTIGVWKRLVLAADITRNAAYPDLRIMKRSENEVVLSGGVDIATPGVSKVICTIPEGFRPPRPVVMVASCVTTAPQYLPVTTRIGANGVLYLAGLPTSGTLASLHLTGLSFEHYYQ